MDEPLKAGCWNYHRVLQLRELDNILRELSRISKTTDAFRVALNLAERGAALDTPSEKDDCFRQFIQDIFEELPSIERSEWFSDSYRLNDIIYGLSNIHKYQNDFASISLILELEEAAGLLITEKCAIPIIGFLRDLATAEIIKSQRVV